MKQEFPFTRSSLFAKSGKSSFKGANDHLKSKEFPALKLSLKKRSKLNFRVGETREVDEKVLRICAESFLKDTQELFEFLKQSQCDRRKFITFCKFYSTKLCG